MNMAKSLASRGLWSILIISSWIFGLLWANAVTPINGRMSGLPHRRAVWPALREGFLDALTATDSPKDKNTFTKTHKAVFGDRTMRKRMFQARAFHVRNEEDRKNWKHRERRHSLIQLEYRVAGSIWSLLTTDGYSTLAKCGMKCNKLDLKTSTQKKVKYLNVLKLIACFKW